MNNCTHQRGYCSMLHPLQIPSYNSCVFIDSTDDSIKVLIYECQKLMNAIHSIFENYKLSCKFVYTECKILADEKYNLLQY